MEAGVNKPRINDNGGKGETGKKGNEGMPLKNKGEILKNEGMGAKLKK